MKVRIKLFALLGKYLPPGAKANQAEVEVGDGATVSDLARQLNLPPEHCHLVLLNGTYMSPGERDGRVLTEGDTVAVWPPVAGGGGKKESAGGGDKKESAGG